MGASGSVNKIDMGLFSKLEMEFKALKDTNVSDEEMFNQLKFICIESLNEPRRRSIKPDIAKRRRSRRNSIDSRRINVFSKGLDLENRQEIEAPKHDKSDECVALLKRALEALLFEESGKQEIELVIAVMSKVTVTPEENVIIQGDHGDKFYVVEHGSLEFVVNGNVVGSVQGGGHFGELALIYDAPRAATVRAKTEAVLWSLGRDDFRTIQAQTSSDSLVRRSKWLQNVHILSNLSPRQLSLLAAALESVTFQDKEEIIVQGEPGNSFYIVEKGTVKCLINDSKNAKNENNVAELSDGEYFGELALLNDKPRNASIVAKGEVKCLKLGRREFDSMLGPLSDILEKNNSKRILRMFPEFQNTLDDELEAIILQFDLVEFKDGAIIFSENSQADTFYIVKEGTVNLTDSHSMESFMQQPGDYFGSEMFKHEQNHSRATASGMVKCMKLTRDAIAYGSNKFKSGDIIIDLKKSKVKHEVEDIDFKDLFQIGVLGEGSFAKVSMVQAFINDIEYILALKAMSKSHLVECLQVDHVLREKEILLSVPSHPFIVRLYKTGQNQNFLFMLMELVQGGELLSVLHDEENEYSFDEDSIRFYAANIYLALEHLHRRDIAYRDLKPENLLFAENGYLKLVDFGFAKVIPFTIIDDNGREETHSRSYTLCGTQEYLAPEYVLNTGHDLAVDYWALGVLIYEMIMGYTPFETEDGDISMLFKNIAFVRTGTNTVNFPEEIENLHPDACDLIRQLLNGEPNKRLGVGINGAAEIKSHPYFSSIRWDDLLHQKLTPPYTPKLSGRYDISCFEGDQGLRANDEPFDLDDSSFEGF